MQALTTEACCSCSDVGIEEPRLANLLEIFSDFTDLRLIGGSLTADVQRSASAASCAAEMLRLLAARFTRIQSGPDERGPLEQQR